MTTYMLFVYYLVFNTTAPYHVYICAHFNIVLVSFDMISLDAGVPGDFCGDFWYLGGPRAY